MGLFEGVLGAGESLFKDEEALEPDFIPKLLPYRDQQQHALASCIKPLIQDRNGRNAFVFGPPGIGKTAAVKWVLRDLNDEAEEIKTLYINCWQKNTTFQIYVDLCHQLEYRFTQNKRAEELLDVLKTLLNTRSCVLVFDEVDKAEDFEFLYSLLNELFKRSIILITNYKEWIINLEDRLKSRLIPDMLEFKEYNHAEIEGILRQRLEYSFVPGTWEPLAFKCIVDKTAELKDIRAGIYLLKQAGLIAEEKASKKISLEHAQIAVGRINEFSLQKSTDLEEDSRVVLEIVRTHSGEKIGELFKHYKEKGGSGTYKTFQRRIAKLEKHNFIITNKVTGAEGNTTLVSIKEDKKLTEF